jgi:hypothetical protein
MINALQNTSVLKTFTVSGEITDNYAIGVAGSLKVTTPTGYVAVVQAVLLKNSNDRVGVMHIGAGAVCSTAWNNPFVLSGAALFIGATGDDIRIVTTGTAGSCYYIISGYMVPATSVNRITA